MLFNFVSVFFSWWGRELAALWPWRRDRFAANAPNALLLVPAFGSDGMVETLSLHRRQRHEVAQIGQFPVSIEGLRGLTYSRRGDMALPLHLVLPGTCLLEKELRFPLAAEASLTEILALEIARETPFDAEEVVWDYRVQKRQPQQGWLTARIWLIPRKRYSNFTALMPEGAVLSAIETASPHGELRLLQVGTPRGRPVRTARRRISLAGLCLILALVDIALPFIRQQQDLAQVDREITAVKPDAELAQRYRSARAVSTLNSGLAAGMLRSDGDVLQILSKLSRLLPATTHLTEFLLSKGQLSLSGRSEMPGSLIALLSSSFANPHFTAPITRLPGSPYSQFSIAASVASGS